VHQTPPLGVDDEERAPGGHAGVVHEQVDLGMPLEDPCRHRLDRVAVADVAELDLGADLVRDCPQPVVAPRDEHAPPALRREQTGARLADPGRGPRDDRDLLAGHGGNLVNGRHAFA
jgi:hypothetical protein